MATIQAYTDLEQSKKLAEILPLESADTCYYEYTSHIDGTPKVGYKEGVTEGIPCWSLAALLNVLPEINDISLKMEKVKAKDGYDGYYYPIEYKGIVLIPYSKNPVDACYEMVLKLHELNLL